VVVQLDPQLMEILACPTEDHAPLRPGTASDPNADALTCTSCGRTYPVVEGIPVLLVDAAFEDGTPPDDGA
jgi:uncharacterized protein